MIVYQISLHGSAYDARDKTWDQMYSETGCKPHTGWLDPLLNRPLLKGEFGCSVSHYRVWQKIAESNLNGLILEEDAVFDEINPSHVDWILEDHDSAWLGYRWNSLGYWYNCHAYAITPDTAKLLIEDFHNNIIPVDEWIPHKLKDANNYFYPQEVVSQIPRSTRPSTIEDTEPMTPDNFHIITVATDESKMSILKQSAKTYGVEITNLGKGSDWTDDMEGYAGLPKIGMVKEFVDGLPKDDIVLFMDAYDTFLADNPKAIKDRFLDFGVDLLFGAEETMWPEDGYLENKFEDTGTPYKYLNSGLYIGRAVAIRDFLNQDAPDAYGDDQRYCQLRFLKTTTGTVDKNYRFPYKVALDVEAYIFQNHDPSVRIVNGQIWNDRTNCCGCIYHGNGGPEAKGFFGVLANGFGYYEELSAPATVDLSYEEVAQDMLVVPLLTTDECQGLINLSNSIGGWGSLDGDKFPAQEIRIKKLGLWKEYEAIWKDRLAPICERFWHPVQYMGLRDAFTMRYSGETQTSLGLHTDASLITGSVKLNDDYEGATLIFPRQEFTNLDVPVGSCILFPSQVTHGHYVDELRSGVKYSLTMWTSRYEGDEN